MFDIILKRKEGTNVLKGIKLRLYPNRTQQNQLEQMFGNDRFVWNQMLAMMNERYQNNKALPFLGKFKLNYLLKPLKKEYPFLKNSDSSSLQVVNEFLTQSWKNFFQDKSGQIGKPRFHSRKYLKKSYTGKSTIRITGKRYLKIPKLGYVKTSKTGVLQKKYSRHRHLVKLLVLQNKNKRVLCPRSLESFTNWQKAQKSKAKYQAKAANQCRDYLHKLTTHLVKQY
ncbi:helix-turn-helix domain-containing protein, partial [Lactobacillus helveticus]|uniref:helix-turn-helix domain-containing protein n=1 Tax=Lactobacillus helveticus TaxID=1587 RepID=UPI0018AD5A67